MAASRNLNIKTKCFLSEVGVTEESIQWKKIPIILKSATILPHSTIEKDVGE